MNCKYKYFYDKSLWCSECLNEYYEDFEEELREQFEFEMEDTAAELRSQNNEVEYLTSVVSDLEDDRLNAAKKIDSAVETLQSIRWN